VTAKSQRLPKFRIHKFTQQAYVELFPRLPVPLGPHQSLAPQLHSVPHVRFAARANVSVEELNSSNV
jgi:hypothetical protein